MAILMQTTQHDVTSLLHCNARNRPPAVTRHLSMLIAEMFRSLLHILTLFLMHVSDASLQHSDFATQTWTAGTRRDVWFIVSDDGKTRILP